MLSEKRRRKLIQLPFAGLLLLAVACSDKSSVREHAVGALMDPLEVNARGPIPSLETKDLDLTLARARALDFNRREIVGRLEQIRRNLNSELVQPSDLEERQNLSETIYRQALEPLAAVALSPLYAEDAFANRSQDLRIILRRFNENLTLLLRYNPNYVRELGLLDRYWEMASVGCERGPGACAAINSEYLQSSSDSSFILEQYAWDLDSRIQALDAAKSSENRAGLVTKKFAVLRMAMAIRNGSDDVRNRLDLLYLMSSRDFQSLPETAQFEYAEQNRWIASRLTEDLPRRLENPSFREELLPFLQSRGLWERFSLRNQRVQREEYGTLAAATQLMRVSCRFYRNSNEMHEAVRKSLLEADALGRPGFLKELQAMRQSSHASVLRNLKVDFEFQADELLFMVDQVYRGHWNATIAQECWRSRRRSLSAEAFAAESDRLLEVIQNYIRVELAKRVVRTNEFMAGVFVPPPNKPPLTSKDIFFRAIDESKFLKDEWEGMILRVRLLGQYAEQILGVARDEDKSPSYLRLEKMVRGIGENVKFVSVYPNMLVLCYYLAAKKFNIKIQTWYGAELDLNDETIIKWIFGEWGTDNKTARPLFNFGNDARPINTFENLYAFFYALKTNSFSNIGNADQASTSNSPAAVISELNFFAEVTRRYINNELLTVNDNLRAMEAKFADQEAYERAKDVCAIEREKENGNGGNLAPAAGPRRNYEVKHSFFSLQEGTFVSYSDKAPGGMVANVYDSTMQSTMINLRELLFRKYVFVETMIRIAEDHWKTQLEMFGANAPAHLRISVKDYADLEKKLGELRENFSLMQSIVRRMEQMFIKRHREIGDCVELFDRVELAQQHEVIRQEARFLSLVYQGMQEFYEAAALDGSQGNIQRLEEQYTAAVNGRIAVDDASATLLQKQLSTAARIYNRNPGDLPGFDQITYRGGFTYSRWNALVRFGHYLREMNPSIRLELPQASVIEQDPYFQSAINPDNRVTMGIRAETSENDFVRALLGAAVTKRYIRWFDSREIGRIARRVDVMAEVYVNQNLGVFRLANEACLRDPSESSCRSRLLPQDSLITPKEIIDGAIGLVRSVHINPEEEDVLRLVLQRTKYKEEAIRFHFLDSRNEPRSILEGIYKKINEKQLMLKQAEAAVSQFNAMLAGGVHRGDDANEWETQTSDELIFLPENDSVRKITRSIYRPIVLGTLNMVKKFEATVKCIEDEIQNEDEYKFLYEIDILSDKPRAGKHISAHKPGIGYVLLESRLRDDYKDIERQFTRNTKRIYQARPGDDDYGQGIPEPDCAELTRR